MINKKNSSDFIRERISNVIDDSNKVNNLDNNKALLEAIKHFNNVKAIAENIIENNYYYSNKDVTFDSVSFNRNDNDVISNKIFQFKAKINNIIENTENTSERNFLERISSCIDDVSTSNVLIANAKDCVVNKQIGSTVVEFELVFIPPT